MIDTVFVFVDVDKRFGDAPAACAPITSVPLLKRILIDLRRAKLENICVLLSRFDAEIEKVLKNTETRVNFTVRLFQDDWRAEAAKIKTGSALVMTADRLSDYRVLETLSNAAPVARAVIAVDPNEENAACLPEKRFCLNDGKIVEPADVVDGSETGIYVLPPETIASLADFKFDTVQRAAAVFQQNGEAVYFDIGNGFVQPIETRADVRRAEQRIIRYIYKATDGGHARLNKRFLLPFLKIVLRTPLTPNMISMIGVVVSLLSGYLFAQGEYVYALGGAILAFVSGLIDHIDGCVARLKSKESAFGAHFETVCDFIFYFAFGVGMTAGLYRASENPIYIYLGAAAFFGTLVSLFMISYQRRRFASNASAYGAEAHKKLDENAGNSILRLGRRSYFVVRRPVLPYYLFVLTLVAVLPFVLFMTALAANLFWIFLLYSTRVLRLGKNSKPPVAEKSGKPLSL